MTCSKCGLEVEYVNPPEDWFVPMTYTLSVELKKSFLLRGPHEQFPFRCRAAVTGDLLHHITVQDAIEDLFAMMVALG